MKILFACFPLKYNLFMDDLKKGLEAHAEVTYDFEEFWACKNHYDIVHIHWPEFLSYEIQKYLWETCPVPEDLIQRIKNCMEYWKKHSTIIYTRHVQYPHLRHDEDYLELYRMVTSYCDVVVHFANYSIQQFKEFYPEHVNVKHVVIPHHNYASIPNTSTQSEARKALGIPKEANVMLVFGAVKENEKVLIEKAFGFISNENKVLLAPGWKINRRKIGYIRLREWVWKWDKWKAAQNKRKRINLGFIKDEEAHLYLNAADFLFIPRTNELNSGNITLGCTFGKVVVGKKGSDIGELLEKTGNPTFEVGNDRSLKEAIENTYYLIDQNHGEKNKKTAFEEWNVPKIAKMYYDTMKKAIESKKL